jgi:hypothetical protein
MACAVSGRTSWRWRRSTPTACQYRLETRRSNAHTAWLALGSLAVRDGAATIPLQLPRHGVSLLTLCIAGTRATTDD